MYVKILPFKIPIATGESFWLQEDREFHFYDFLHQHPQIQLSLILESEGQMIAGDFVGTFKPGDIFMLGSNLPHVFRNNPTYYTLGGAPQARMNTVFFEWQSFGEKFLSLPELRAVREIIKLSDRGLYFKDPLKTKVGRLIKYLFRTEGMERLIVLLKILNLISNSDDLSPLASPGLHVALDEAEGKKLSDIYRFTMKEYHRKIPLNEVASVANMTPNSFCRYFRKRTRKSYFDFLIEIRIGHAKKLLQSDDLSISQICFECGFNNISNFNRKFKEVSAVTPTEFRRNHRMCSITLQA